MATGLVERPKENAIEVFLIRRKERGRIAKRRRRQIGSEETFFRRKGIRASTPSQGGPRMPAETREEEIASTVFGVLRGQRGRVNVLLSFRPERESCAMEGVPKASKPV